MKVMSRSIALIMAVLILAAALPTASFATLQNSTQIEVNCNFDGFTKNTGITGKFLLKNAGDGVDFEPVYGVFGKENTDTSVKITRTSSSEGTVQYGAKEKQTSGGSVDPGDVISMRWKWAFGDFNVPRSLDATYYPDKNQSYSNKTSFAYDSKGNKVDDTLIVYPDGAVRLFGKVLDKPVYFRTDEWYDFEVRIVVGTSTSEATEASPAAKSVAYLYVDGALIGQKEINNAKDDSTAVGRPYAVATAYFTCQEVKYADGISTNVNRETTYIDDMVFSKNKPTSTNADFKYYGDLSVVSSDAAYNDGLHLALKSDDITVKKFKDSLTLGKDVRAVKLINSAGEAVDDENQIVQPGWFLNIENNTWKSAAQCYDSYNRKITDSLTYYRLSFEGPSVVYPAGFTTAFGYWSSNVEYYSNNAVNETDRVVLGLRDDNVCFVANKYGKTSGDAAEIKLCYNVSSGVDAEKYVIEYSGLRSETEGNFADMVFKLGGIGTIVSVSDDAIMAKKDDGAFWTLISKTNKFGNRWVKLAAEVDTKEKTIKVYVNGDYVLTRTKVDTDALLTTGFGILCNNKDNYTTTQGLVAIDDINIYSGTYKASGLDIVSSDADLTPVQNEVITVAGDISVGDFKAATGADCIYVYSDGAFGAEVTADNVADGNVAVFTDNNGLIKYYDIELLPVIGDVTFDTSADGKITANVSYQNRSATKKITSGMLVIANRTDNEIYSANMDYKDDTSLIQVYNFSATADYENGDTIYAYFWNGNTLTPFFVPVPYTSHGNN